MDIFTLDKNFIAKDTIDNEISRIWTERYSAAGDVTLVVKDTPENRAKLAPGTFLACSDSKEVMQLETHSMEKGLLTVTGDSITKFLDHRIFRASGYWNAQSVDIRDQKPGPLMGYLVEVTCISGIFVESELPTYGVNGYRQKLRGLSLADIYSGGVPVDNIQLPFGGVYSILKSMAETYTLGFQMYLESANSAGYSLKFRVYGPRSWENVVIFSEDNETLTDTKEIVSMTGYKNVCYAFATQWTTPSYAYGMGVAYAPGFDPDTKEFDRRVMQIYCDDFAIPEGTPTEDAFGRPPGDPPPGYILPGLNQRAANALANNNFTRMIDGQIPPSSQFKYGVDYNIGDFVGLRSRSGYVQRALVTEFIRSKDADGEKEFPTVSVVDLPV